MSLDLLNIFDDFVQDYSILKLTNYHPRSSFTLRELNYFFELGQKMGYESFTEDSSGSSRAMDLSWWGKGHGEYWGDLVLHLERENLWKKDEETLQKLFQEKRDQPPANVIGMIPVPNKERAEELVKEAVITCNVNNTLLIFRVNPDTNGGNRTIAYLLEKKRIVEHKTAYVFTNQDTGYLSMDFSLPN